MANKKAVGKPLLFGDATFDDDRIEQIRAIDANWDRSYVPGYGEKRMEYDLAVRDKRKPPSMPRLQWIRLGRVDGTEVGDNDMVAWALLGYRFMTKEDLEAFSYGMPPTAYVDPQGRIRRADLVLAFVDEARWKRNVAHQREINAKFHGHALAEGHEVISVSESNARRVSSADVDANYVDT